MQYRLVENYFSLLRSYDKDMLDKEFIDQHIDTIDEYGDTILHFAILNYFKREEISVISEILDRAEGVALITKRNNNGETPVYYAAIRHPDCIKKLLAYPEGIDALGIPNKYGDLPLHNAATFDRFEAAKIICSTAKGTATINAINQMGHTPLHNVVLREKFFSNEKDSLENDIVNFLENFLALPQVASTLLSKDNEGNTPLDLAAINGKLKVVEYLYRIPNVSEGIATSNFKGSTLLHILVKQPKVEIINFFLSVKLGRAMLSIQDEDGNTPLLLAINNLGASEIGIKIIKSICDTPTINTIIGIADKSGMTPLHHAIKNNFEELVQLLLPYVNINQIDLKHGETLLHFAARYANLKIIKMLLKANADCNIKDKYGRVPLELASLREDVEKYFVVSWLRNDNKSSILLPLSEEKEENNSKSDILPNEILLQIFSFATIHTLSKLAQCNKNFREITNSALALLKDFKFAPSRYIGPYRYFSASCLSYVLIPEKYIEVNPMFCDGIYDDRAQEMSYAFSNLLRSNLPNQMNSESSSIISNFWSKVRRQPTEDQRSNSNSLRNNIANQLSSYLLVQSGKIDVAKFWSIAKTLTSEGCHPSYLSKYGTPDIFFFLTKDAALEHNLNLQRRKAKEPYALVECWIPKKYITRLTKIDEKEKNLPGECYFIKIKESDSFEFKLAHIKQITYFHQDKSISNPCCIFNEQALEAFVNKFQINNLVLWSKESRLNDSVEVKDIETGQCFYVPYGVAYIYRIVNNASTTAEEKLLELSFVLKKNNEYLEAKILKIFTEPEEKSQACYVVASDLCRLLDQPVTDFKYR